MGNHHDRKKKTINGPCSIAMYDDCMILDVFWNIFWLLYYFVPDTAGYLLHISPCVLINPPLRFSPIVSWLGSPRNEGVLHCAPPFLCDNYDKGGTQCPLKKTKIQTICCTFWTTQHRSIINVSILAQHFFSCFIEQLSSVPWFFHIVNPRYPLVN